ncbi:MAG TPA: serine/threonine-protein kinase, partial [Polyangiaceae bacterium]
MSSVGAAQQILSGKYRLERELGRGGMGSVWLAEHLTLRSPVAIKLIDPTIADNPEALARFLREAQAAASLRSPHVVQILDHGVDNGVPFIVMELLEGESLASKLERERCLSPGDTARIMTQVARAVGRAHEAGIVHRDLKPDNIYLVRNDEEEVAKVLDFGVAKSSSHGMGAVSSATRTGSVLGTPYYMSPEQAEGAKTVDHRSDLWALGVIAWECVLGARPFEAETLGGLLLAICARDIPVPSTVGSVPPGFDAWFARACSRNVSQRFGSAKELASELRQVCAGGGVDATGRYAPLPAYGGSQSAGDYGVAGAISAPGGVVSTSPAHLASTTGQLGLSTTSGELSAAGVPPLKKSKAPLVALALLIMLGVAGAAAFALREAPGEPAATSASPVVTEVPVSSALPSETAKPAALAVEPAKSEAIPSAPPSSVSPPVAALPSASPSPRRRPAAAPARPARSDRPTPAAASPPPAPEP